MFNVCLGGLLSLNRCLFGVRFQSLLGPVLGSFIFQGRVAPPHGPEQSIPECEERLGEVRFDAPTLMVNIVVCCIVARDVLDWVPG